MTSSVERFARRQALLANNREATRLVSMPSSADALRLAAAQVDYDYLDSMTVLVPAVGVYVQVPDPMIESRLSDLAEAFQAQSIERLFADSRRATLHSITSTFGLGKMLSAYDKVGGSVDTIHNARAEVYATDEAKKAYDNREAYDDVAYHTKDPRYIATNRKATKDRWAGELKDSYTGDPLGRKESQSLDHTIAAKEIHNDPGRVLAKRDGVTLANEPTNLNATTKTTNSAMQQKSATDYVAWLESTKPQRDAKLAELRAREASGETLGKGDATKLAKLTEQEKIAANPARLLEADRKARAAHEKEINSYYKSPEFLKACVGTSTAAGNRAAFQAAVGAVLVEAFAGIWDEVRDWYQHGATEETVGTELKRRLKRVGVRVAKQWKTVLADAAGGFVAGFLANLITVLINAFLTTAKRAVRMIREGATSLLTACKTLLVRPEGMTLTEGVHEASKVLIGGAVVVGGVALEEAVSKYLAAAPFVMPFADIATAVIVGSVTALASTIAVYLVDRADLFGVNRAKLLDQMNAELDSSLEQRAGREANLINQIQAQLA